MRPASFFTTFVLLAARFAAAEDDPADVARVAELEAELEETLKRIQAIEGYVNAPVAEGGEPRRLYVTEEFSIYPTPIVNNVRPGRYSFRLSTEGTLDHMWGVICGILTLFMQSGLIIMQSGFVRFKNVQTIIYKHVLTVVTVTVCWYALGYMFALGGPNDENGDLKGFVGTTHAFAEGFNRALEDGQKDPTTHMIRWFSSWSYAIISATTIPGAVAERVHIPGMIVISILYSLIIYPFIVAWSKGNGWIHQVNDVGPHDQAGGGYVFLTGGVAALVGCVILGKRERRFGPLNPLESDEPPTASARFIGELPEEFHPHSLPLVVIGGFMMWFGFYGFACGSTESMATVEQGYIAGLIAMNVTIAAATSGLTSFIMRSALKKRYDIAVLSNGIVAGLVSIASSCNSVEPGSALGIGIVGGLVHICASGLLKICQVDDPVDSFAVFGACGMWSVIAAPVFDMGKGFSSIHHRMSFRCVMLNGDTTCTEGLWGQYFGAQFLLIVMIWVWTCLFAAIGFLFLKKAFPETATPVENETAEKDGGDTAFIVRPAYYKGDDWREVI